MGKKNKNKNNTNQVVEDKLLKSEITVKKSDKKLVICLSIISFSLVLLYIFFLYILQIALYIAIIYYLGILLPV